MHKAAVLTQHCTCAMPSKQTCAKKAQTAFNPPLPFIHRLSIPSCNIKRDLVGRMMILSKKYLIFLTAARATGLWQPTSIPESTVVVWVPDSREELSFTPPSDCGDHAREYGMGQFKGWDPTYGEVIDSDVQCYPDPKTRTTSASGTIYSHGPSACLDTWSIAWSEVISDDPEWSDILCCPP